MPSGQLPATESDPQPLREDRYRRIFLSQQQYLVVLSPGGVVEDVNDVALAMGGLERSQVVGHLLWECGWWGRLPEMRQTWQARFEETARTGRSSKSVGVFHNGTGEVRYALDTVTPLHDSEGRLEAFLVQGQDVTDHVAAEFRLKEKDTLLELAGRMARLGGWSLDLTSGMVGWSDEVCTLHGVPPGTRSLLEGALRDYAPESREALVAMLEKCRNEAVSFDLECRLCQPGGEEKWVRVMGEPVIDGSGKVRGIQGAMQDVTQQKRVLQALADGEQRFKSVAQATNDAIWDWDVRSNRLWWSDGFTRLFGFERQEIEAGIESWVNRVHPEDREEVVRGFYDAVQGPGDSWASEYRFLCKDGRVAHVLDRGRIVRNDRGQCVRMVGGMSDITHQKQAERELADSNRALKMLMECNEAMIRASDESALLAEICRIAVDKGGYVFAWVGYAVHDDEKNIRPVAHAGAGSGFLEEIALTWAEGDPRGMGPGGRAIRQGEPVYAEDIRQSDSGIHWLDSALKRGFYGVICLPLKQEGRTFGILALYSGAVLRMGPEEVTLLQELADDLAFGIHHLRSQNERRQLEAAVVKVASSVTATIGEQFFEVLAKNMAAALGAHAGFVARLLPGEPLRARTVAAVVHGEVLPNIEYPLEGRPCENLAEKDEWVIPSQVTKHFPSIQVLRDLGAEAYAGCRLVNGEGEPIGLLYVLFRESIEKPDFVATTLKVFATRAAAELERQDADRHIRQQASLLDHARDAILVRDLENRILYWNKGAERLYGWTAEEVRGREVGELIYRDRSALDRAVTMVITHGEWTGELHHVGKDGRAIVIEGRWTLLRDKAGQPQSILAINTDVTERKRLEQQFLRAQRMESIGTLAGGIAHDLNNVLSPITMAVDLLKLTVTGEENLSLMETIADSARRGADMVRQVLSFARGMEGQRVQIQVRHLVREIEKIVKDTFPKNIRFRTRVAQDLHLLNGDPTQLHQVLLNLCVNSRDAMPDGGDIIISASNVRVTLEDATSDPYATEGPHVVIEVRDTGTGIPQSIIDKVFDPFFTTKEVGKGTGLGLSTSLAIVKSHEGFIRLESQVGSGTVFRIYLPARGDGEETEVDPSTASLPRGQGEWILVVDDEELIRQIARQTLVAYGYHVLLAADGVEALAVYRQNADRIALVVTDMMMPIMDGATTIKRLMEMNPEVKIIAASGIATNDQVTKTTNLGVRRFLAKPYTVEALLAGINEVLGGR